MTARSQLLAVEKKKLHRRYPLLMRIIRFHDRIDQRKNVRKGQMLPVFYRALFFFIAPQMPPVSFHVCFFPFLFTFFLGLQ